MHAFNHKGAPSVILAQDRQGLRAGRGGRGQEHHPRQKKLNEAELLQFRSRFDIPMSEEEIAHTPFFRPADDSPEIEYLQERRRALGGYLPRRVSAIEPLPTPTEDLFDEFYHGTDDREVSTTMVFVRILGKLLRDKGLGKNIVPIVPDEARTFGMEALFRQVGIYSHVGQLYEPVDSDSLLYYKEAKTGQILEEGITEAGSMSSFIAAGTAYANYGIPMLPFYIYYSMFGFQRIGDLVWAAADMRCRGFLVGATAGRTTLAGEGLQHQDGHSHLLAYPVPNLVAYDPAFAYELAVIIQDGIKRMMTDREDIFYYITVGNENYAMQPMPAGEGVREGILRGMYRVSPTSRPDARHRAQLFGSGSILNEALKAQKILEEQYGVGADVWSVTSYKELRRDGMDAERWNLLQSGRGAARAVHHPGAERCAGRVRVGVGLRQDAVRLGVTLVAQTDLRAGHRRLWPQREPRRPARLLRGRRALHHPGDAEFAGAAKAACLPASSSKPSATWTSTRRSRTRCGSSTYVLRTAYCVLGCGQWFGYEIRITQYGTRSTCLHAIVTGDPRNDNRLQTARTGREHRKGNHCRRAGRRWRRGGQGPGRAGGRDRQGSHRGAVGSGRHRHRRACPRGPGDRDRPALADRG